MSSGARSLVARHYERVLSRWPKDALRPEGQLQDVLLKRLEKSPVARNEDAELRQVNALYTLLADRYKTKYRVSKAITQPQSNPTYYTDLIAELEAAPTRSWLSRLGKRLGGLVRLS